MKEFKFSTEQNYTNMNTQINAIKLQSQISPRNHAIECYRVL